MSTRVDTVRRAFPAFAARDVAAIEALMTPDVEILVALPELAGKPAVFRKTRYVGHAGLREAMERRRRSRSYPERVLQRLLGLDLKLRQYEEGKAFCDAVVELGGIGALNRVWGSPESLPAPRELREPAAWLERVGQQPAAPAAAAG